MRRNSPEKPSIPTAIDQSPSTSGDPLTNVLATLCYGRHKHFPLIRKRQTRRSSYQGRFFFRFPVFFLANLFGPWSIRARMTEDAGTKPSEESVAAASAMRQRKKRKWDEPADFLISTGISIPGASSIGFGNTVGISAPGVLPLSNAIATNTIVPLITQSTATLVQKLNQPKVQDELIAREIIINDAESTIRYKLTKRQTQEEIQRSTGAIVITRGKYRPPNALPDSEKPLYLHISAGSHLKDLAERIIAVDRAASMVEEILQQGHNLPSTSGPHITFNSVGQVNLPLSACLFLGFEPDPSQNIAARIRGPNDQYINHIINETGATVVLRGLGSGNQDISSAEDAQLPLHLYLSSTNTKSLEAARSLAENLLDTISAECGVSRISSIKAYSAVPPPQQLLTGVVSSANTEVSPNPVVSSTCAVISTVFPSVVLMQNGGSSIPNTGSYAYPTGIGGTCYSGYGGIYPQATPLQQVALALKQAPLSTTSVVASTTSHANALPKMTSNSNVDTEKRPSQKRKFQELPVISKGLSTLNQNSRQGSECFKPGLEDAGARKMPFMPPPNKLNQLASGKLLLPPPPPPPPIRTTPPPPPKFPSDDNSRSMPPPPPKFPSDDNSRSMPPPPPKLSSHHKHNSMAPPPSPPPKFPSSPSQEVASEKSSVEPVSDTPLKLVEYDEEEEEDDMVDLSDESCRSNIMRSSSSKPFWAV